MPDNAPPPEARSGRTHLDGTRTALVLSGGSALGAYEAGAYEALHRAGLRPDWIVGTSIGAVNGAIIAGNRPEDRTARLRRFWDEAATRDPPSPPVQAAGPWRSWRKLASALGSLTAGQPRVFRPRPASLLAALPGTANPAACLSPSLHGLEPLERTLRRLVDFDRINDGGLRLTMAAVDITSGEEVLFDTRRQRIEPAHVLASASMPPEFPPHEVDGRWFCDGGLAANTPVDAVLDEHRADGDLVCFAVDLFDPDGTLPRSLDALIGRRLDLSFAGQTRLAVAAQERLWRLRRIIAELGARLPEEVRAEPGVARALAEGSDAAVTLVQLRHAGRPDDVALKMYEFSRTSLAERWAAGAATMAEALRLLDRQGAAPRRPGLTVHTVRG